MKRKRDPLPDQCAHFTGSYVGQCRAGVAYDSVKDQSQRNQLARFPCQRSANAFTSCERAEFTPAQKRRRRINVSQKNWNRMIVYQPKPGTGARRARGRLVGCSADQLTAFIETGTPKRPNQIAVPANDCRFSPATEEEEGRPATSLPLFERLEGK